MRRISEAEDPGGTPKRLAYADPPYPGHAWRYRGHPDYAGEVDHKRLIASLVDGYDGWALSTSAEALSEILPMCPADARVAPWCKSNGAAPSTRGPHNLWEPVIYMPARLRRPGVRDWLLCKPARGGGTLVGRKPIRFCAWMFSLLGAAPADTFDDLFPGTGIVGRAWGEFCRSASPVPGVDAGGQRRGQGGSLEVLSDASSSADSDAGIAAPRPEVRSAPPQPSGNT